MHIQQYSGVAAISDLLAYKTNHKFSFWNIILKFLNLKFLEWKLTQVSINLIDYNFRRL